LLRLIKKLLPLALVAAVLLFLWKRLVPTSVVDTVLDSVLGPMQPSTAKPGDSFWSAGNRQAGDTWWNLQEWLRGGGPQRNNPATGSPIPDAELYPGDPGGTYTA
jgi:hypothetical protein